VVGAGFVRFRFVNTVRAASGIAWTAGGLGDGMTSASGVAAAFVVGTGAFEHAAIVTNAGARKRRALLI